MWINSFHYEVNIQEYSSENILVSGHLPFQNQVMYCAALQVIWAYYIFVFYAYIFLL